MQNDGRQLGGGNRGQNGIGQCLGVGYKSWESQSFKGRASREVERDEMGI